MLIRNSMAQQTVKDDARDPVARQQAVNRILSDIFTESTGLGVCYETFSDALQARIRQLTSLPQEYGCAQAATVDPHSAVGRIKVDSVCQTIYLKSCSPFASCRTAEGAYLRGRWMFEVVLGSAGLQQIGWHGSAAGFTTENGVGDFVHSYAFDGRRKSKWNVQVEKYGEFWEEGDTIGSFLDFENRTISFSRNGIDLGIAYSQIAIDKVYYPAISLSQGEQASLNIGMRPFYYSRQGFLPLVAAPHNAAAFKMVCGIVGKVSRAWAADEVGGSKAFTHGDKLELYRIIGGPLGNLLASTSNPFYHLPATVIPELVQLSSLPPERAKLAVSYAAAFFSNAAGSSKSGLNPWKFWIATLLELSAEVSTQPIISGPSCERPTGCALLNLATTLLSVPNIEVAVGDMEGGHLLRCLEGFFSYRERDAVSILKDCCTSAAVDKQQEELDSDSSNLSSDSTGSLLSAEGVGRLRKLHSQLRASQLALCEALSNSPYTEGIIPYLAAHLCKDGLLGDLPAKGRPGSNAACSLFFAMLQMVSADLRASPHGPKSLSIPAAQIIGDIRSDEARNSQRLGGVLSYLQKTAPLSEEEGTADIKVLLALPEEHLTEISVQAWMFSTATLGKEEQQPELGAENPQGLSHTLARELLDHAAADLGSANTQEPASCGAAEKRQVADHLEADNISIIVEKIGQLRASAHEGQTPFWQLLTAAVTGKAAALMGVVEPLVAEGEPWQSTLKRHNPLEETARDVEWASACDPQDKTLKAEPHTREELANRVSILVQLFQVGPGTRYKKAAGLKSMIDMHAKSSSNSLAAPQTSLHAESACLQAQVCDRDQVDGLVLLGGFLGRLLQAVDAGHNALYLYTPEAYVETLLDIAAHLFGGHFQTTVGQDSCEMDSIATWLAANLVNSRIVNPTLLEKVTDSLQATLLFPHGAAVLEANPTVCKWLGVGLLCNLGQPPWLAKTSVAALLVRWACFAEPPNPVIIGVNLKTGMMHAMRGALQSDPAWISCIFERLNDCMAELAAALWEGRSDGASRLEQTNLQTVAIARKKGSMLLEPMLACLQVLEFAAFVCPEAFCESNQGLPLLVNALEYLDQQQECLYLLTHERLFSAQKQDPSILLMLTPMAGIIINLASRPSPGQESALNRVAHHSQIANIVAALANSAIRWHRGSLLLIAISHNSEHSTDGPGCLLVDVAKHAQHLERVSELQTIFLAILAERKAKAEALEALKPPPEEFMDSLMGTVMQDPVMLPSSKAVIDKVTLEQLLYLKPAVDPYTRSPINAHEVIPQPCLKAKIDEWVEGCKP